MHAWLQIIVAWVADHPELAWGVVFLIALGESLAVVGLLIPGSAIMFAIGALVAAGALNLWTTLAAAAVGAVVGDSLSYWLGYHYCDHVRDMWPFRKHPQWLQTGERFIQRHGGKSVLFGRFVGPVRPIVPVVAGMMRMSPRRFLWANLLSALLWAPAYMAPGIGFGVAFDLFSRITLRLALLFGLLVGLMWLTGWAIHRMHGWLVPRANATLALLVAQREQRPWLGRFAGLLIDPRSPDLGALAAALVVVAGAAWGLHELAGDRVWSQADQAIYGYLAKVRSPWGDHVMQWLGGLGTSASLAAVTLWGGLWLALGRRRRLLFYWLAAALVGVVLQTLETGLMSVLTVRLSAGAAWQVSLYGLLAMLAARRMRGDLRWLPYSLAGLILAASGLARVYLGSEGFSAWLGGALLGVIWVTLVGVACLTHVGPERPVRGLLPGAIGAALLGLVLGFHPQLPHSPPVIPKHPRPEQVETDWWQAGWHRLPAYRVRLDDDRGEPLNIQWAGSLGQIMSLLVAAGWQPPPPLRLGDALNWLLPGTQRNLPLLPRLNDGRRPALVRIHALESGAGGNSELVLRLWPSGVRLADGRPVWIGSLRKRRLLAPLGLLLLPRYGEAAVTTTPWLAGGGLESRVVYRQTENGHIAVLLLRGVTTR
ncbi:hypothetical protein BJI67_12360 [Acidihalobacter aeolianus]|uniref:Uncharacterized protein n=1 Tax=Acidihalobacter aeolianus TaxID=2792603 RepID=A0A1D8K9S4_9GAMM|nr:VTT domain-containing protein [Acidihalobacter aeolianus]AOV17738.1 hypothetical protein BJI67_12360 [Acidihalobacter aeolianus]